jgi:S-adenosylmethionine decarboxylase
MQANSRRTPAKDAGLVKPASFEHPWTSLTVSMYITVGTEWVVDASGCRAAALRDRATLERVFRRAIDELGLAMAAEPVWHVFPGEGGVTGMVLLTESHLVCHTYPEHASATFNLYCCRERPEWPWAERLGELLGASEVTVRRLDRAAVTADATLEVAE